MFFWRLCRKSVSRPQRKPFLDILSYLEMKSKHEYGLTKSREAQSFFNLMNKRIISDFEVETRDFVLLCLIASANGLEDWPPQDREEDEGNPGLLTFH